MVNLRHFVIAALGSVVAVLSVMVWYQHRQLELWRGTLNQATDRADDAVADRPERANGSWVNAAVRPTGLVARTPVSDRPSDAIKGISVLMQDPVFIRALMSHQRTLLDSRFAELFRRLELTPDELEKVRELLIEKQNSALDVLMLSHQDVDLRVASAEVNAAAEMARGEVDEAIALTLGPERYAVFRRYEETLPQRATVQQLAQRLSYSDTPLRSEQAEALVDLMVDIGGEVRNALPGVSLVVNPDTQQAVPIVHGMEQSSHITDELLAKSEDVLEPRQVVALRQLRQEQGAAETVVSLARTYMSPMTRRAEVDSVKGLDIQLLLQ